MHLLHEYLQLSADRFPDKTALICGDREYTYRELHAKVVSLAAGLCAAGIRRGTGLRSTSTMDLMLWSGCLLPGWPVRVRSRSGP